MDAHRELFDVDAEEGVGRADADAGSAAPRVGLTPGQLLYRMTSPLYGGITNERHLIFNLCAEATA